MNDEINPNHPVTQKLSAQWPKIAAIIMHKLGVKELRITMEDLAALPPDICIGANSKPDALVIFLTDIKTAQKMAAKEGGLPV